MPEKTIAQSTLPAPAQSGQVTTTRQPERYIVPAVDIFETQEGLTLVADLPGASKDGINVKVEEGILTIQAKAQYQPKANVTLNEYELLDYFRQFELTDFVDQGKITAEMRNGVLVLQLPKAEKAKPKQVKVKVA